MANKELSGNNLMRFQWIFGSHTKCEPSLPNTFCILCIYRCGSTNFHTDTRPSNILFLFACDAMRKFTCVQSCHGTRTYAHTYTTRDIVPRLMVSNRWCIYDEKKRLINPIFIWNTFFFPPLLFFFLFLTIGIVGEKYLNPFKTRSHHPPQRARKFPYENSITKFKRDWPSPIREAWREVTIEGTSDWNFTTQGL